MSPTPASLARGTVPSEPTLACSTDIVDPFATVTKPVLEAATRTATVDVTRRMWLPLRLPTPPASPASRASAPSAPSPPAEAAPRDLAPHDPWEVASAFAIGVSLAAFVALEWPDGSGGLLLASLSCFVAGVTTLAGASGSR